MPLSTKKERKREEDAPPPTEPRAVTLAPGSSNVFFCFSYLFFSVAWGGNWASKITESAIGKLLLLLEKRQEKKRKEKKREARKERKRRREERSMGKEKNTGET